jgi:hypothetical protein
MLLTRLFFMLQLSWLLLMHPHKCYLLCCALSISFALNLNCNIRKYSGIWYVHGLIIAIGIWIHKLVKFTISLGQKYSWEAGNSPTSQEISCLQWNSKVLHNSPTLNHSLSSLNSVYMGKHYVFKPILIWLQSKICVLNGHFPSGFPIKITCSLFIFPVVAICSSISCF